jgi:hypothetical protein
MAMVLVVELEVQFPTKMFMDALKIIYFASIGSNPLLWNFSICI